MPGLLWTFVAPMGFYCAWQLSYFVIVQVGHCPPVCCCAHAAYAVHGPVCRTACPADGRGLLVQVIARRFILAYGYETSYRALARRAARTNNFWNRLVRKGSVMRRCAVFGASMFRRPCAVLCSAARLPAWHCWQAWSMRLKQIVPGAGAVQAAFTLVTLAAVVLFSQSVYLGLVWQVRRPPTCSACLEALLQFCVCFSISMAPFSISWCCWS